MSCETSFDPLRALPNRSYRNDACSKPSCRESGTGDVAIDGAISELISVAPGFVGIASADGHYPNWTLDGVDPPPVHYSQRTRS